MKIKHYIEYSSSKERQLLPTFALAVIKNTSTISGFSLDQAKMRMESQNLAEVKLKIDVNFNLILIDVDFK